MERAIQHESVDAEIHVEMNIYNNSFLILYFLGIFRASVTLAVAEYSSTRNFFCFSSSKASTKSYYLLNTSLYPSIHAF